jgi:hypothetical protein
MNESQPSQYEENLIQVEKEMRRMFLSYQKTKPTVNTELDKQTGCASALALFANIVGAVMVTLITLGLITILFIA